MGCSSVVMSKISLPLTDTGKLTITLMTEFFAKQCLNMIENILLM